jgi:hypothetical protein
MSAKFIRRIVEVIIAIFFTGGFLLIGRAVAKMFDGDFGTLSWPIQAGAYQLEVLVDEGARATFDDGILVVSGQPFWHSVDLIFSIATIGIFITTLIILRTVLVSFAEGDLVNAKNAGALRKIGLMLFAVCGLSVLHALILQPAILASVTAPAGTVLHPSISWNVAGVKNIWLHFDVPILTFTLGGLALLFSEAFKAGTAYREDSESVV